MRPRGVLITGPERAVPVSWDWSGRSSCGGPVSALALLALMAAALGVAARVHIYLAARSLWNDELHLASNIVQRSWLGLARPLDHAQSAPLLFLWLERAATRLAGPTELPLRAVPFACGSAIPVALWLVGRRLLGAREALFASIFASLSGLLIYYANETKQYGADALVTVLLLGLTWDLLRNPAAAARWWRFSVGTTALLTLSQPAAFVLVGVAAALILDPGVRRSPKWLPRLAMVTLLWGATLGGLYLLIYHAAAHDRNLAAEWSGTFLDFRAPDLGWRVTNAVRAAFVSPLPWNQHHAPGGIAALVVALAFLLGTARAAVIRSPAAGALLVLPLAALTATSALGRYPIADRLLLFAAPLAFLALGSCLSGVAGLVPAAARRPAETVLGGLCLILGSGPAIAALSDPVEGLAMGPPREEARALVLEAERLRAGDWIYVFPLGTEPWAFYTADWSCDQRRSEGSEEPSRRVICPRKLDMHWDARNGWREAAPSAGWSDGEVARMAALARPHMWLFASHFTRPMLESFLASAERAGASIVYAHLEPGAALYQLRFPEPAPAQSAQAQRGHGDAAGGVVGTASSANTGWTLVWSDEFSGAVGTPPDPSKWSYDLGGGGWGNRELEVYTNDTKNVFQDGKGHLIIRAVKSGDGTYTSARLKTKGKYEVTYGRVEARIRIPYGQGIWPAFWMLGADIGAAGWPACGEIDVMENRGVEPLIVRGTLHGPGYSGSRRGIASLYTSPTARPFTDDFHVFSVDWSPGRILFLIDGNRYAEVTPSSLPQGTTWVFDHPFFILLNVAVGGEWPGNPDHSSVFPQTMSVDWVRVWKRDGASGRKVG